MARKIKADEPPSGGHPAGRVLGGKKTASICGSRTEADAGRGSSASSRAARSPAWALAQAGQDGVSLADARDKAKELNEAIESGVNPLIARRERERSEKARKTLRAGDRSLRRGEEPQMGRKLPRHLAALARPRHRRDRRRSGRYARTRRHQARRPCALREDRQGKPEAHGPERFGKVFGVHRFDRCSHRRGDGGALGRGQRQCVGDPRR